MDGKNREEQENGAKVRDLEEYKADAGSPLESLQEPFSRPELVQGYGFSCVLFRDTT